MGLPYLDGRCGPSRSLGQGDEYIMGWPVEEPHTSGFYIVFRGILWKMEDLVWAGVRNGRKWIWVRFCRAMSWVRTCPGLGPQILTPSCPAGRRSGQHVAQSWPETLFSYALINRHVNDTVQVN